MPGKPSAAKKAIAVYSFNNFLQQLDGDQLLSVSEHTVLFKVKTLT